MPFDEFITHCVQIISAGIQFTLMFIVFSYAFAAIYYCVFVPLGWIIERCRQIKNKSKGD